MIDERRGSGCRAFRPCSSCGLARTSARPLHDTDLLGLRHGLCTIRTSARVPLTRRRWDGLSARTVCRRGYGSERVCIRNRTGMHTESKWYAYRIGRVCIPDCSGMHVESCLHACRFRCRSAAVSLRRVRHSDELRNENEIIRWFVWFGCLSD